MTDPNSPIIDFYPTGMSIIQAYTQYLEVSPALSLLHYCSPI